MRTIALYGKGGIGKTTQASNLSILFARSGHRVLQIGCDPKHDSCYKLVDRGSVRTVMGILQEKRDGHLTKEEIIMPGRLGVDCIETGGPEPGVGCAGRGITKTFEILRETDVLDGAYDVVIFDVLGDVVCGGFAAPLRGGFAREVYVVLSGEVMALYAANNICRAVAKYSRNGVLLGGLTVNLRNVPHETEILANFAAALGTRLLHPIPRDPLVYQAECMARTVVEFAPDSEIAAHYASLFSEIEHTSKSDCTVPSPLDDAAFERFLEKNRFP